MVLGRIGRRHHNGGLAGGAQFGQCTAAAADHQIGLCQHFIHIIDVLTQVNVLAGFQIHTLGCDLLLHPAVLAAAGGMDVVKARRLGVTEDEILHLLIHILCADAAPEGHHQRHSVVKQRRVAALIAADDLLADGTAGNFNALGGLHVLGSLGKVQHDAVHLAGQLLDGDAGHGIDLQHGGLDTALGRCIDHGKAGIAAGAHDDVGFQFPNDLFAALNGLPRVHQRLGILHHTADALAAGQTLQGEGINGIARTLHQFFFDVTGAAEKPDLGIGLLLFQIIGYGQSRVHVTGGTAACKNRAHGKSPFLFQTYGLSYCDTGSLRETDSRIPTSPSRMSSAVPP